MELVSVVVTTYKRPPHIVERAIRSIVEQTYENIEIIVVDDSPSDYLYRDDIKQITEIYGKIRPLLYLQHEKNKGACAARNTGIKNSKGAFICFLDDDDEYVPIKVERQMKLLSNAPSDGLVYCGCIVTDDDTGERIVQKKKFYRGNVYKHILEKNFIGTTSFPLIRKQYLINVGGFDEELPACQDYDMWIRLCEHYSVDFINEPLVIYHNHSGDQITKSVSKRINALTRLIMKNEEAFQKNGKLRCIFQLKLMNEYLRENNKVMAKQILKECFLRYPWLLKQYFWASIQIIRN